jgi:hypothetical protein
MSIIATPSPGGQNCLSHRAITQAAGLGDWQQGEKQALPSIGLEHLVGDCMEALTYEGSRRPATAALLSYTNFPAYLRTWTRSRLSQRGTSISLRATRRLPTSTAQRHPPSLPEHNISRMRGRLERHNPGLSHRPRRRPSSPAPREQGMAPPPGMNCRC